MSARPAAGIRAAWFTIALLVVSLPHALEDFAFGQPARLGVPAGVAVCVLLAAYASQLGGAWLALRGNPWGGRVIAATGLVWVVGALLIHGPEIGAEGLNWRFGLTSVGDVLLIVVVGALATWFGIVASQSVSQSA